MKKLAAGVYMESGYPGVCLGAIVYSRGLLLVDTPPIPEDGRNWISALKEIKSDLKGYWLILILIQTACLVLI